MLKKSYPFIPGLILASVLIIPLACEKKSQDGNSNTAVATDTIAGLNELSDREKSEGWELLFDGTTLNGWKRYNHDSIGPLWSVDNGAIKCDGKGLTEGTADIGGSLITIKQYGNFDLRVDWKVSPGGNSGIHYHVVERPEYKHEYETGPEYQVMDDAGWTGDPLRKEQFAASNYDMYAASETKKINPAGEWNSARIVYNNGHVEHYLNGEKVLEFDENSDDFKERYQKSKWPDYPGWNQFKTGSIALQDHGAAVYFRNIKIKEL